jgi:DNA-binding transcriptional MerR regulator
MSGTEDDILFDDRGAISIRKDMHLSMRAVSRAFRVSRPRLWWYERLGLIRRRNRFGQGFVYSWDDCARIVFLIKARRIGVAVRHLAPIIRAANAGATPQAIKQARAKCVELIDRLDIRRRMLREAVAEVRLFYQTLSEKLPADVVLPNRWKDNPGPE